MHPDAGLGPAIEAIVDGGVGAVALRQVALGRSGSEDPEDTVQDPTIVHPSHPARLVGKERLDQPPLEIRKIETCHESLLYWRQ